MATYEKNGKLKGRVAIITGATSGIGKATALLFAEEGAQVVITGRREALGGDVVTEIQKKGGRAFFIKADHTNVEDCSKVVEETLKVFGKIDILFNNAGYVKFGTAETTPEEDWDYTMALNVTSVWRMSRLVIPHMRGKGGVIINNASDWGLVGAKNAVAYCTSKGAVVQMTRAMALGHAHESIRINAVCPGDTFVDRWINDGQHFTSTEREDIERGLKEMGEALPIGRVGDVSEIARVVLFLASDDSSFITGVALPVDGGNTAR
jgi:meso-butanediol dehydrogenase/(S,S)-butanediol dehydrogenase/diacetyl reductase